MARSNKKSVRVLSGKFKSRVVKTPEGIRPTEQKVRKALFDILGEFVEGTSFLELFAGCGAVGIEAMSLGAAHVCFAENDRQCTELITENCETLGIRSYALIPLDALRAVARLAEDKKKFDIIFLDPPYYKDYAKKTLLTIAGCDIVNSSGFVIAQHFKNDQLEDTYGELSLYTRRRYGTTFLSFYRRQ
ncbi:16S rRNA (guanine(966)-N(2))-methyltransferase RsmD [Candidatus Omnitrophota bacterium]